MQMFTKRSVARGLDLYEFMHLSNTDKGKLIRLLARVSEASYRRGFQHGIAIEERRRILDPVELRFKYPLDESPFVDGGGGMSAKDRLFAEYGELMAIGLSDSPNK